jgi:hypothetical protein
VNPNKALLLRWLGLQPKVIQGKGHIIISGTGRAGTTLLVQIFTHLGFDTGFEKAVSLKAVDRISHAGLERSLLSPQLPYVVKSPWFVDEIDQVLKERTRKIKAAIIPIRRLHEAAESRRRVWREAKARGLDPLRHPGTIWKTEDPAEQEAILAIQLYNMLESLISHGVPTYCISFPRFARDGAYLYRALQPIFAKHGISEREVVAEHRRIADRRLIHRFDGPAGAASATGS